MRTLLFIFVALWCAAFPHMTLAADAPVTFLSQAEIAQHQDTINRIQDYLSSLTTAVADFTQVAPDGSLATGKFYLQRPGKMRWQYNPPAPILMVAGGGNDLIYYDSDLKQVTHIPIGYTLISFLAQKKISFNGNGVGIVKFEEAADVIRITVAQTDKPSDGQLTLEFSDAPLLIRNMIVRDATNQVTSVSLQNAQFGITIDPDLFVFHDPRKREGAGFSS